MHSRTAKTMLLLGTLLLVAGAPAWSQAWAGRGRLQGAVKDEGGKPVAGAKVTLRKGTDRVDPGVDGPASLTTDKNGKWSILGLAQGAWGILIEKEGFIPSEGQVQVNEFGPAQPINVTLKVIPKEVIEKAQQEDKGSQAKAALQRGNALINEAEQPGALVSKCKSELKQGQQFEVECRPQIEAATAVLEKARAAYEEGLSKLDDKSLHPAILIAIANIYDLENKPDLAVDSLKRALDAVPDDDDTPALQRLVDILMAADRETEAQAYIAKLPEGTKMDPNTILNLGIKAFNEGKMDQALGQFDRVVKENPNLPDAYYYRALVYMNQDKKAQAKADLQKLLALDPNSRYADDAKAFLKDLK